MSATEIPASLTGINTTLFSALNFEMKEMTEEKESKEYAAYAFRLDNFGIIFRKAKITPTKVGQFVTIWKRNAEGVTQPYEFTDDFDFMIITTQSEHHSGVFIFPKSVLLQKNIIIGPSNKGKRGIRVYPSWDTVTNKQAEKTQKWQLDYFLETATENTIDIEKAGKIFSVSDK
jgi:hypothetical protein